MTQIVAAAPAQGGADPPPAAAVPESPATGTRPGRARWGRDLASALAGLGARLAWGLLGCAGFVALWQLAATASADVPTPVEAARALGRMVGDPFYDRGANDKGIAVYLSTSLRRVFAGFAMAAAVGIPVGLLIGASHRAWQAINPVVQLLRPVSPLAWFPILLAVFHDAGQASVFTIFVTALWPTLLNTATGAATVPADHRNVARVFRFDRFEYLRHVLVPNALPSMITGLRLSLGIAWVVIVAAEMLSGNSGIGFFVWDTYNAGDLANVTAAITVIGVVGLVLDAVLLCAARWLTVEDLRP